MNRVQQLMCAVFATTTVVAGCTDYESSTDLNPDGPPMVEQVRMRESYKTPAGVRLERPLFGFGTHPDATETTAHPVTSAVAKGNKFRIIMDELLVGNNLEEVACRGIVDTDAYSRVPNGSTPDDVARCATAQDVLPGTCKGEHAMCLCELDAGCSVQVPGNPPTVITVAKGQPVGIDDKNQDGAADDTQFIRDAVGIKCGSISVPIDLNMSYWNPSGNQQVPAMGGFDALGPAIVLVPTSQLLPTNLDCQIVFAADVVDKQNIQVCAPPNGDVLSDCTPGDTTKASFKVEPLTFTSDVAGATGVSRTAAFAIGSVTTLDPSSVNGITITGPGATPFTAFVTTVVNMGQALVVTPSGTGFAANTTYTLTVTSGVKDTFGQAAPAPYVITFTTGA